MQGLAGKDVVAYFMEENNRLVAVEFQAWAGSPGVAPASRAINPQFQYLQATWEVWNAAVDAVVPDHNKYYTLHPGISPREEDDHHKLSVDHRLPEELMNFYRIHDLADTAVAAAFGFEINNWRYDLRPYQSISKEWHDAQLLNQGNKLSWPAGTGPKSTCKIIRTPVGYLSLPVEMATYCCTTPLPELPATTGR